MVPVQAPVSVDPLWVMVLLSPWTRVAAFVWGSLWGSFSNVVIHRLPLGLSVVKPRSRCPECGHSVRGFDNIPVLSYLWLRGRCRDCKTAFGPRYVVVEVLAGLLSTALYHTEVVIPLVEGGAPNLWRYALLFVVALSLLVVVYIDLDAWIIPDEITLGGAVLGVGMGAFAPHVLGTHWAWGLGAGVLGYGLFWLIRLYYLHFRGLEALGLGDAKLLLMMGCLFGPAGMLWMLSAGAVQGTLVAIPMLLLGRDIANSELEDVHGDDPELGEEDPDAGVMGKRVPFGPFLALAGLEYVVFQRQVPLVWDWLLNTMP